MTLPIRTELAASTTNRKWYVDVSPDGATWTPLMGITENNLAPDDATWQDDSDVDGGGARSQTKSAFAWGGAVTVRRAPTAATPTAYDPGQELCRKAAIGKTGPANSLFVRWYEMEDGGPREEAYSGRAGVQWAAGGGGMDALSRATITFQGQGALSQITHPDPA